MKTSKIMVFRILKWLALAWAILFVIIAFVYDGLITAATPLVLFAIFFHLEQHKS